MSSVADSLPRVRKQTVLGASMALYVASLLLPAMYFDRESPLTGMTLLAEGWWGMLMLNPSWFANPLYVVAVVQFARRRYARAALSAGAAVVCALCSLLTTEWYFNEADATPIRSLGIAFYMWAIAQIVLLLGSLRLCRDAAAIPHGD
ncbi:hypothetical protein VI03_13880 [Burkholderia vietnamiensis]|uniref:Transmembrane protein n=1 Tax=Burkholderia vietnamiensis TaxID=60552 RepID=A0AAW7SX76_BURVI|nr:hypothetical protein [Burkholderia vietnamiensis]KKI38222.1 hypothetical protein VI03_13880 [Burkholderia vietnamiensis]MDN7794497.1 hypothetical protein [Burkholderia vietnamiensis]MDN8036008.1 hypothetical protein [Burkholderia vietnamiensis]HDR9074521.1 hypothetical protein [Burkholderia vietnamiensis]HDR9192331.1 hypothetical protein [Burkholderia vietnamiensis]